MNTLATDLTPSFSEKLSEGKRKRELTAEQVQILKDICTLMEKLHGKPFSFFDNPMLYLKEAISNEFNMYSFHSAFMGFRDKFYFTERAWLNFHYGIGNEPSKEIARQTFDEWDSLMPELEKKFEAVKEEYAKLLTK